MRFSWGQAKSAANLVARAFDFEFATLIFDGPTLQREDRRQDYGERRMIAIGLAQGVCLTVAFTDRIAANRQGERRIISARRSNRREHQAYEAALGAT